MIYSVVTPNTHAHVSTAHISLVGRKQNVRVADKKNCDICLSHIHSLDTSRYNAPGKNRVSIRLRELGRFRSTNEIA